jgi:hypothetical protein
LNSWGIRYVKKASVANKGGASSDIESRTTSHLSDIDVATGTPADRQSDSAGDKDVKVLGSGQTTAQGSPATAQQVHSTVDSKGKPHYSSGSRKRETISGNTSDDPTVGSTQGGKGSTTLTQQGKLSRSGSRPSGSAASHDSGIKDPFAAEYHESYDSRKDPETGKDVDAERKPLSDKKRDQQGNPVKYGKPREGGGKPLQTQTSPKHETSVPKGGQSPKIKAALDFATKKAIMDMNIAILKCKTFKLKRIDYSGEDSQYGDENDHDARVDSLEPKSSNESSTTRIEDADGKLTEVQTGYKKWKKENEKKASNDVVAKAIELINEAYDQIGKDSVTGKQSKEGKPESGHHDLRTSDPESTLSDFQWHKSDVANRSDSKVLRTDEPERTVDGKVKPNKNDSEWDQKHDNAVGIPESDRYGSERVGMADTAENRPSDKYNKDRKIKGDSAVTTGTEGTINPVMAGKKEPFGKELDRDGRKDEYTPEEHAEHNSQKD